MYLTRISWMFVLGLAVTLAGCDDSGDTGADLGESEHGAIEIVLPEGGCFDASSCEDSEICVASLGEAFGQCVSSCSVEDGDVCPRGEYCTRVIDASGARAGACVTGEVVSQDTWQSCDDRASCSVNESCVHLDEALGARCVPSCNPDGTCQRPADQCLLRWEGEHGAENGCAQRCTSGDDCDAGWRCELGATIPGICVR